MKDQERFLILTFVSVVQTDIVSYLSCKQLFVKFELLLFEGISSEVLLHVYDRALRLENFLIEANNILWAEFRLKFCI